MYRANEEVILGRLRAEDVVLDIGGWARPFNRADFVMDQEPYESRGHYGLPAQGGERERFSRESWIRRDICERTPYPFADKSVDFVICSHTLEDLRDPLWVCSEMIRIGRAGYIEVPSRLVEACRGVEPGQVGFSHHRWLIDMTPGEIRFMMKYHTIHSHWSLSLPRRFRRRLGEEQTVQWMFWTGSFAYGERIIHGPDNIRSELRSYVQRVHPYPGWLTAADRAARRTGSLARRALVKARLLR
jgi:hypothetical protein